MSAVYPYSPDLNLSKESTSLAVRLGPLNRQSLRESPTLLFDEALNTTIRGVEKPIFPHTVMW